MDTTTDHFTPLALRVRGNYCYSDELEVFETMLSTIFILHYKLAFVFHIAELALSVIHLEILD